MQVVERNKSLIPLAVFGLKKSYDRWQSEGETVKNYKSVVALWHIPEIAADPSYKAKREQRGVSLYALRDKMQMTPEKKRLLVTHKAAAAAHNK
jgi:hypothetical protein